MAPRPQGASLLRAWRACRLRVSLGKETPPEILVLRLTASKSELRENRGSNRLQITLCTGFTTYCLDSGHLSMEKRHRPVPTFFRPSAPPLRTHLDSRPSLTATIGKKMITVQPWPGPNLSTERPVVIAPLHGFSNVTESRETSV